MRTEVFPFNTAVVADIMQYMEKVEGSKAAGAKNVPDENASSTASTDAAIGLQLRQVALHGGYLSNLAMGM